MTEQAKPMTDAQLRVVVAKLVEMTREESAAPPDCPLAAIVGTWFGPLTAEQREALDAADAEFPAEEVVARRTYVPWRPASDA